MNDWDSVLIELADDPGDYDRQSGLAILGRRGKELWLSLKEMPGIGLSVEDQGVFVPISTYIQRNILELPQLSKQIIRALERSFESRPGKFIEGPAEISSGSINRRWESSSLELKRFVGEAEPGTTRVIQLMAAAGQGKTVLLEKLAMDSARSYQPDPYPTPILLTVDLLGRYVGDIADAIAGSLNNTYLFPSLTQRDVVLCIRQRWLLLALDGFDELVARIGARDAFLRVTELLEQLQGSGTIILSARESFFELFQITSAIRSYLQPKNGSYSTSVVQLLPWGDEQGKAVFAGLGSPDPERELNELFTSFDMDRDIVFHPFFLTRLADLWIKGERFEDAGSQQGALTRTKYVIEAFINRESKEKWIGRDGTPLLSTEEHNTILSWIAEEMWRSGAFRLSWEELRVATEIGITSLKLPLKDQEAVIDRIRTHAALVSQDRGYSFLHDHFLHFFLGYRISNLLEEQDRATIEKLLEVREIGPSVVEWIVWNWNRAGRDTGILVESLNSISSETNDSMLRDNLAHICAKVLKGITGTNEILVQKQTFQGDAFSNGQYNNISFIDCEFWHIDFANTIFASCSFLNCRFGDILVNNETRLDRSNFNDYQITSVESLDEGTVDEGTVFTPEAIAEKLRQLGATIDVQEIPEEQTRNRARVSTKVSVCVERYVKASERTCDVAIEEMVHKYGDVARDVAKIGIHRGVLREIDKAVSGPKKTFVRFRIDRANLLRGQIGQTGETSIDGFWEDIAGLYPPED